MHTDKWAYFPIFTRGIYIIWCRLKCFIDNANDLFLQYIVIYSYLFLLQRSTSAERVKEWIEFEMNGIKSNWIELRVKCSKWANKLPNVLLYGFEVRESTRAHEKEKRDEQFEHSKYIDIV